MPLRKELGWLSIKEMIMKETSAMMYKSLNNLVPQYISELLVRLTDWIEVYSNWLYVLSTKLVGLIEISAPGGGGGYLVYLSDGDVPFFRVSFSPIFLQRGIKRRQIFWSRLSKHVKRGNFVRTGYYSVKFSCFWVYFSPIFSRTGYHLKAKILEQGEKICCRGHIPVQI